MNHGPGDMRMYYHSFDLEAGRYRVGVAQSADGFKWRKVRVSCFLVCSCGASPACRLPCQQMGPIFDGSAALGEFDSLGARFASVQRDPDSGRYLMFYEGVGQGGASSAIGLAVSPNGVNNWKRWGQGMPDSVPKGRRRDIRRG